MDGPKEIPLHQFQQWMQQMLLDPFQQTEVDPVELLPNGVQSAASCSTGIDQIIEDTGKLDAARHLGIYQRSYIARLRNCMSQQFSALEFALGENIFIAFADEYLASRPSTHYNLGELGRDFANYIQGNRPDSDEKVKEDWIDFMIELAEFEYEFSLLYDRKGDLTFEAPQPEESESIIQLRDVCDVFEFQFPIRWFYTEFKNDRNPSLPHPHQTFCLIVRHNFQLSLFDLNAKQFEFLSLMKQGLNLKEASDQFKKMNPDSLAEFEAIFPKWKKQWLAVNLLKRV